MRALVTGGGGFLGTELCRQLRAAGDEVHSVSRGDHPHLRALGVVTHRGDLADAPKLAELAEEMDVVFHVAAKAGVWGRRRDYFATNLEGTEHVLAACRSAGVPRLVHTSSPSVCFDGKDHRRVTADLPRATNFLAHYPASKAAAEERVLAENDARLTTCALRPHLIFGPGDPHLLPRLVDRARAGRLAVVGAGDNEVPLCYVENAAHAHVLAARALEPGAPHAGRAYFIGQEQPVELWPWIDGLLEALDVPPVRRRVSQRTAHVAGAALEGLWRLLSLPGAPPLTRFVAAQLATSHSYSMQPARDAFGYRELVDLEQATRRSVEWLRAAR